VPIRLRKNCLICGDRLKHGTIFICESTGEFPTSNDCIKKLPDDIFEVPYHIPDSQNQQFSARLILKHRERILNDNNSIDR
jgi:hypothetical protein